MQPEQNAAIQSEPNRDLEDLVNALRARRERLQVELNQLNALLEIYQSESSKAELKSPLQLLQTKPKPPRVRGVLAGARKAIDQLESPFDKNDLLSKLVEIDEEFVHKKITGANIRNALRLLVQAKVIEIKSEATATTCAKYVKC
jgi:hypothetical protein